tara:strand:+ start:143 stop:283 length:141 start_codon:yes stop_codon:yes gene_type:complete
LNERENNEIFGCCLLFLFTLYLFQYFNESRKETSENVKEFIEKYED